MSSQGAVCQEGAKRSRVPLALLFIMAFYIMTGPSLFSAWSGGSMLRQMAARSNGNIYQYIIVAASTALFLVDYLKIRASLKSIAPTLVVMTLVWCAVSVSWSDVPAVAARRCFLLAMTTIYTLYAIKRVGVAKSIECTLIVCAIVLLLDFLAVVAGFGVHSFADVDGSLAGNWKGIHPHKNVAAAFVAPVMILSFWKFTQDRSLRSLTLHILSIVFLFNTGSKTGIFAAPIACYGVWAVSFAPRWVMATVFALTVVIAASFAADGRFADLFGLSYGSFTGRGQIWIQIWPFLVEHMWTGVGFGSFWGVGAESPVLHISTGFVAALSEAHNGYFDVALATGIVGLVLAVLAFFVCPAISAFAMGRPFNHLCWSVILFNVVHNFFESALLATDFSSWYFVLLIVAFTADRHLSREALVIGGRRQVPSVNRISAVWNG